MGVHLPDLGGQANQTLALVGCSRFPVDKPMACKLTGHRIIKNKQIKYLKGIPKIAVRAVLSHVPNINHAIQIYDGVCEAERGSFNRV